LLCSRKNRNPGWLTSLNPLLLTIFSPLVLWLKSFLMEFMYSQLWIEDFFLLLNCLTLSSWQYEGSINTYVYYILYPFLLSQQCTYYKKMFLKATELDLPVIKSIYHTHFSITFVYLLVWIWARRIANYSWKNHISNLNPLFFNFKLQKNIRTIKKDWIDMVPFSCFLHY
jgi:hypothetical protein